MRIDEIIDHIDWKGIDRRIKFQQDFVDVFGQRSILRYEDRIAISLRIIILQLQEVLVVQ